MDPGIAAAIVGVGGTDERIGEGRDEYVIMRAISNARRSIGAFLREESLPPPTFPGGDDFRRLAPVSPRGHRYDELHRWLADHPEPD